MRVPFSHELLQEKAYRYLVEQINKKRFESGKVYSERQISAEIGISRTPFKDALTRLSQDKYIDIVPSKGFCLHEINQDDIREIYQIRTAIEGYCAIHLMNRIDTEEGKACIQKMHKSLEEQDKMITGEDENLQSFLLKEDEFHLSIVEFSGNETFISLFSSYRHQIHMLAAESLITSGRMAETVKEHKKIVNAIEEKNEQSVYDAVRKHMRSGRDINLKVFHAREKRESTV